MATLRELTYAYDADAPLVVRLRFILHRFWRGDLPAEVQDVPDPPVVGRRVTDEADAKLAPGELAPSAQSLP